MGAGAGRRWHGARVGQAEGAEGGDAGDGFGKSTALEDAGGEQDDEFVLDGGGATAAEQGPDNGQAVEAGGAFLDDVVLIVDEAADDDGGTVGDEDVGGELGGIGLGDALGVECACGLFRVDFEPDHAVVGDEGTEGEQGTDAEELDGLEAAGEVRDRVSETEALAELNFRALLVEDENAWAGQDVDLVETLDSADEPGEVVGDEAELEALVGQEVAGCELAGPGADDVSGEDAGRGEAGGGVDGAAGAADEGETFEVVDDGEVDAELLVVAKSDAEDDGLDEDLGGLDVEAFDDLVDGLEVLRVVANDDDVMIGGGVATGTGAAGGCAASATAGAADCGKVGEAAGDAEANDGFGGGGDRAVGAEKGLDHNLKVDCADVVEVVDADEGPAFASAHGVDLSQGVDVDEAIFLASAQGGEFEHGFEGLAEGDIFEVDADLALHSRGDQDVDLGLAPQQGENLANVLIVDAELDGGRGVGQGALGFVDASAGGWGVGGAVGRSSNVGGGLVLQSAVVGEAGGIAQHIGGAGIGIQDIGRHNLDRYGISRDETGQGLVAAYDLAGEDNSRGETDGAENQGQG